ncbi:MAG: NUDIX hydrolase [Opitutales bacterium]
MSRAQCIVVRGDRVLMVKHRESQLEWWCLPGGGINPGEAPEAAALRELKEECCVTGHSPRTTSIVEFGPDDRYFTYLVQIGDQTPTLGDDPDKEEGKKVLADLAWLALGDLAEGDRAYLWTAGLLTVELFAADLQTWDRLPSKPKTREPIQPPVPTHATGAARFP